MINVQIIIFWRRPNQISRGREGVFGVCENNIFSLFPDYQNLGKVHLKESMFRLPRVRVISDDNLNRNDCWWHCCGVFTSLSFTCHFSTGWGDHPAAWHSNRTDCPWKANLFSPRTFTLPFSVIRKQSVTFLSDVCLYLSKVDWYCSYPISELKLWTKQGRILSAPSSVSSEILVFGWIISAHRGASPLQLAWSLTKDGFQSSWVIDHMSPRLNCLTNASPFLPFPASQISHFKALGDIASHMWSLLSGRMKGSGGNTQLLQTGR